MCYYVGALIFLEICKCYCFASNNPLNDTASCFLKLQPAGISDFPHANIPLQYLFNNNLIKLIRTDTHFGLSQQAEKRITISCG